MAKFLGSNGLTYLWSKIKAVLSTKVDKVATTTDNAIARYDGTTGSLQNSGVTINDSNQVSAAKFITSGGTGTQVVLGNGNLASLDYIGKDMSGYLVTHPEAENKIIVPFLYNDIAFLRSQGGDVAIYSTTDSDLTAATLTIKRDWTSYANVDNLFDTAPNYWNAGNTYAAEMNEDGIIIDLTLPKNFVYGTNFYIDFGNAVWGYKKIDVFVRNSSSATSYTNKVSNASISSGGQYYFFINQGSTGYDRLRIYLHDRTATGGVRIAQIGLIQYGSLGHRYTVMSRGIDDGVWRNISPYISGGYTLGTSSKRWSNIYTNYGNFANAITASSTITATGAITGGSFIKTGGTSSQFLKADGSIDSTSYAPQSSTYSKTEVDNKLTNGVYIGNTVGTV